MMDIKHKTYVP